jgi:hypothetical protein
VSKNFIGFILLLTSATILLFQSCYRKEIVTPYRDMKAILKQLSDSSSFPYNPGRTMQGIQAFEYLLTQAKTIQDSVTFLRWLADYNLRFGRAYRCIENSSQLKKLLLEHGMNG